MTNICDYGRLMWRYYCMRIICVAEAESTVLPILGLRCYRYSCTILKIRLTADGTNP